MTMIYSHPGRLLSDHLQSVEKKMIYFYEDQRFDTQKAFGLDKDGFKDLIHAIAISHDLGKATKKFQDKLFGSNSRSPHSEISAVYAYAVAKKSLLQKLNVQRAKELSFYAFLVVRRHHGFLKHYIDEVVDLEYEKDKLEKITKSIDRDFSKWFEDQTHIEVSIKTTQESLADLRQMDLEIEESLKSKRDLSSYFTINFLYSLLVDADRIDAATYGKRNSNRIDFNTKIIQNHMKEMFKNSDQIMDILRKEVHEDVLNQDISLEDHFYTITVPTGGGKTFTSFDFALRIRDTIKEKEGRLPRIIYALPFTSLIDQNAKRIKDLFAIDREVSTNLLLVQHHLTPNEYIDEEEGSLNDDLSSLLISGWDSEIIITTFVSLFEGLISNRRADIRKLHTILGSVIILDEVQNIPHEYWKMLSEVFNFMSKNFGNYFILTTATKPQMFIKSKELAKYKFELNRIKIINEIDKINTLDDLYDEVVKNLDDSKRVLVILNTISSSQKFFKMFDKIEINKFYLSAGIIPKIRKRIIEEINKGNTKLLVSTQVVEAGMDIDFDIVYRDMAPLDSIIQSCGRCNRNYERDLGIVHLIDLKNENGTSYSKLIYDDLLTGISREILKTKNEIFEKEIQEYLIGPYFESVAKNMAQSEKYLESLKNLMYFSQNNASTDLPISNFSIIKGFLKANVYIQYDQRAIDLYEQFEQIQSLDPKEWYTKATTLFKEMNQYIISVNITKDLIENCPPIIENQRGKLFFLVTNDQLSNFYDEKIGFHILRNSMLMI